MTQETSIIPDASAANRYDVRADQVEILFKNIVAMLLANVVNASLVHFLLRHHDRLVADLWLAAILAICLLRLFLAWAYRRHQPGSVAAVTWGRLFTLGSTASGLVWGLGCMVIFVPGDAISQLVLAFVVAGMAAGGVAGLHVWLPAAVGFITPTLLGMMVILLYQGQQHYQVMAAMAGLMWVALMMISVNFNRTTRRALTLKQENLELTQKLQRAEIAEAVNQAMSNFFAAMSHEFRTPLNAILGFADLIRRRTDGPIGSAKYEDYIEDINISAANLLELVNETLELSKLEAGAIELDETSVNVQEAVRTAAMMVQEEASGGGIRVKTEFPSGPLLLRADERVFRQIVLILLSKAVRFATPGDELNLSTEVAGDGRLAMRLRGIGAGLAREDVSRLLADFDQVDTTIANKFKAGGLGLGVARPLIELHGGKLEVGPLTGIGTTVTAYFPAERLLAAY